MATQRDEPNGKQKAVGGPNKRELQRQIGRTRESLTRTVEEIKQTAGQGYEAVTESVSGMLNYREQFQKEPLVWSLGALSAGFALGYAFGYGHKAANKARHSQFAQYADRMIEELSTVGQSVLVPTLNSKIKELFGLDFAELLSDMRAAHSPPATVATRRRRPKSVPRKKAGRKSNPTG